MSTTAKRPQLLEARGISKAFGGVQALDCVSLDIAEGEIHAVVGENGAGKSTLIKILSGSYKPDAGEVVVAGAKLHPGDVHASEAAGIAVIHQESTAFPHLDAVDNIFVGREPRRFFGLFLDRPLMRQHTDELLARLGEKLDPMRPVGELSVAERQMVGMARALSTRSKLLIMDEPTASLSARETEALFRVIRQLQADGVSILYISHRLDEVFELADRVTVLRDGRSVGTQPIEEVTRESLIRMMVGRDLEDLTEKECRQAPSDRAVLEVKDLAREGVFSNVSFNVMAGEIVGLAGLVGAGRSEVAKAIFGIDTPTRGRVSVNGSTLLPGSVQNAIRQGVALVPEDRQHEGLVLPMPLVDNLSLVNCPMWRDTLLGRDLKSRPIFRSRRRELEQAERLMREWDVRAAGPSVAAETLSGGNQQKAVLAKWLASTPKVLILDEPTRGVDVGAKAEVHRMIRQLAQDGMAVLLISSDLPEVLSMSDRIIVMRGGIIAGELSREEATQEKVLELALVQGPPTARLEGA